MTLLELIKQVKELDEKATPGPWYCPINGSGSGKYAGISIGSNFIPFGEFGTGYDADAKLAAQYRTAAPRLAKACEVLEEALSYITVSTMTRLDGKWGYECADIAKKALAEVERILCQE